MRRPNGSGTANSGCGKDIIAIKLRSLRWLLLSETLQEKPLPLHSVDRIRVITLEFYKSINAVCAPNGIRSISESRVMEVEQVPWSIEELVEARDRINLNPLWQRGPAWRAPRQVLLIDSILRGMDIPKIYLRRLSKKSPYKYDAVDGQQRLRAIWEFREGQIPLDHPEPLPAIEGHTVAGRRFDDLHHVLRARFDGFIVSVAEIVTATNDEITNLFSRLQMGVPLNPAELRNAILRPMRHVMDALATSHVFFAESRIPEARYKRQDYVTHAFAMAAYQGQQDIKAKDLKKMVLDFGPAETDRILEMSVEVGEALNVLAEMNHLAGRAITQKWIFVDLLWLIMQRHAAGATIDTRKAVSSYLKFEKKRREFNSRPEVLIRGRRANPALDRHLYNYILAFKTQGGQQANLNIRNRALRAFCRDIDRRD